MKPTAHACWVRGSLLLTLFALSACSSSPTPAVRSEAATRQITAASQCGFDEPGLVYMDSRQRLDEVTGTRGVNLTAMNNHDFNREHLLLIGAGRKPTGGYGVALDKAWFAGDVLTLTVTLRSPSADQMVTQALTSPCAVVAVPSEGWDTVQVKGEGLPELSLNR